MEILANNSNLRFIVEDIFIRNYFKENNPQTYLRLSISQAAHRQGGTQTSFISFKKTDDNFRVRTFINILVDELVDIDILDTQERREALVKNLKRGIGANTELRRLDELFSQQSVEQLKNTLSTAISNLHKHSVIQTKLSLQPIFQGNEVQFFQNNPQKRQQEELNQLAQNKLDNGSLVPAVYVHNGLSYHYFRKTFFVTAGFNSETGCYDVEAPRVVDVREDDAKADRFARPVSVVPDTPKSVDGSLNLSTSLPF